MQIGGAVLVDAFRATAPVLADFWALFEDTGDLVVEEYIGGFRMDVVRGTVALPQVGGENLDWSVIHADSFAAVSPGAILWRHVDDAGLCDAINSWDVGAGTPALYTVTAPAGTGLCAPIYMSGWVYWLEADQVGFTLGVRLKRARADFSDVEQPWELLLAPVVGASTSTRLLLPRLSATFIRFIFERFEGEVGEQYQSVGILLSGDDPEFPTAPTPFIAMSGIGLPYSLGSLFALAANAGVDTAPFLWTEPNDADTAPSAVWPDPTITPTWVTGWQSIRSFALNPAKTKATVFGHTADPSALAFTASAFSSEGLVKTTVEEHPTFGFPLAYLPAR